jgi:hypothetical protein
LTRDNGTILTRRTGGTETNGAAPTGHDHQDSTSGAVRLAALRAAAGYATAGQRPAWADPQPRCSPFLRLKAGKDAKGRGLDPDQARDEIFPRLHNSMVTMTGDDPKLNDQFKTYLVDARA